MNLISENKMYGGVQRVYTHRSEVCACDMQLAIYLPPQICVDSDSPRHAHGLEGAPLPALVWLSGLTCTEQNFIQKAGAQRLAAELGMVLIVPDTSPRGAGVADDPEQAYDMGLGAGFYLNAIQAPWSSHYQMYSYVAHELPNVLSEFFIEQGMNVGLDQLGIAGHSMGGHGAITIHLKNPERFTSVSALAPIASPSRVAWGRKAFSSYLGDDEVVWQEYDSIELLRRHPSKALLLVHQGTQDEFIDEQLKPEWLREACEASGQPYALNYCEGYDHSYYFIGSFIDQHLLHHYHALTVK